MNKKKTNEPDLLIESMQKLIDHMNDNKIHQQEIFQSLNGQDILKILQNFDETNISMRKTSAAFLCELLYDNLEIQRGFCNIVNIPPIDGKICVNKIPQSMLQQPKQLSFIFEAIKSSAIPYDNGNYPLCWYYEVPKDKNYKSGVKYIKFEKLQNAKQKILQYVDPQHYLFGFILQTQKQPPLLQFQEPEPKPNRIESSKSTYVPSSRTPQNKTLRPTSGSSQKQSPLNSVSPMVKKTRIINTSVDFDQCKLSVIEEKKVVPKKTTTSTVPRFK